MNGPQAPQPGVYGTLGTFSPGNLPPIRNFPATWADSKGNLWLFGGDGGDQDGKSGMSNDMWEYDTSTNQWAWVSGASTHQFSGFYDAAVSGTLRVPAPGNVPAGRTEAMTWTDKNGDFWLFGGDTGAIGGYLNDLWKYSASTHQWAWMSGTTTIPSCPQGNCGLSGVYGALGKPATANNPGARSGAATWTDSQGNLWLFGGYGYDSTSLTGYLNDLWFYSLSTNQWTWMGGSSSFPPNWTRYPGQSGVYGAIGESSPANLPGGRSVPTTWVDQSGKLWLFGGSGFDSSGTYGQLNDLWRFDPSTNQWTWVNGKNVIPICTILGQCGVGGVYGQLQVPATENLPGVRERAAGWTDKRGNLWLFGGQGLDSVKTYAYLNDLWRYNPSTNQWTWMAGTDKVFCPSSYCDQPATYGTLSTPGLGNAPSGRMSPSTWTDPQGNLWLYGGQGIYAGTYVFSTQDVWEYQPNTNGSPVVATPTVWPPSGSYTNLQTLTIDDTTPGAAIYYTVNGNTPATLYTGPIPLTASQTIQAIASASGYANSNIASAVYSVTVASTATPTFSLAPGTYATPQSLTIADATSGATIYYTTDGTRPSTSSTVYSGPIAVSSSEAVTAMAVSSGYLNSVIASVVYTIGSGSTLGQWAWMSGMAGMHQPGVYGSLQTPATANVPGSRSQPTTWTDTSGNLWLFGGTGYDANGSQSDLNDLWSFSPSSQQWTWMGGSSTVACTAILSVINCSGRSGVYGTLGASAPANMPGGRWGAAGWKDNSGNFWLFGGYGHDANGNLGSMNDLWKFNVATNQWTWISGSSAQQYLASSLGTGTPGVYGALRIAAAGNVPGGRRSATTLIDSSGRLWLFGGLGQDAGGQLGSLNDLWMFNPSTNQWTWMAGSSGLGSCTGTTGSCGQAGVYGTLQVPGDAMTPGGRTLASGWTDGSGDLWLFGGSGFDSAHASGGLNDLWRFNPSTSRWTWMAGANSIPCPLSPIIGYKVCRASLPVYGTRGVPGADNVPAGGAAAAAWTDQKGNFWIFGGSAPDVTGENANSYTGNINALWVFNPAINEWAWMGGDYATSNCSVNIFYPIPFIVCDGPPGVYTSKYTEDPNNMPPARSGAGAWTDANGTLWMFGGQITNSNDVILVTNDLWRYKPSTVTFPPAAKPIFSLKSGTYVTGGPLTISNGMPNATIYYTTDLTLPTTSSKIYTGPINVSTSQTIVAKAVAPGYRDSAIDVEIYTVSATTVPATPIFSLVPGTYASIQTLALSETTPGASIFYTTDGSIPTPASAIYTSPITVSSSQTVNALGVLTAPGYTVWHGIANPGGGYVISPLATAAYTINLPQTATPVFSVAAGTYPAVQTVTITDGTPGSTIYYSLNGATPTTNSLKYTSPLNISSTSTVQAIAVATGYSPSAVATAIYTINLVPPDFTVAIAPTSITVAAGQNATGTVTLIPLNAFQSAVSFSCSGLPTGASCNFSPQNLTPLGGPASATLTVTTSAKSAALRLNSNPLFPGSAVAVALCCFGLRKQRRMRLSLLIASSVVGMSLLNGCGSSSTAPTSTRQPVTSTVTVIAVSGSIQHTTALALTVN